MAEPHRAQAPRVTARHPPEYTRKDDFPRWFKIYRNYTEVSNIPENTKYGTMMSFLDADCFNRVERLNLTQAEKNNITDLATYQMIKNCLRPDDDRIPPGYALKYRKQGDGESVEEYALELEKLALEAYPEDQNIRVNQNLIETFIAGITNDELAIKLLGRRFDNLTEAVREATQYHAALKTRRFIKSETEFKPTLEKVYSIVAQPMDTDPTTTINTTAQQTLNKLDQPAQNNQPIFPQVRDPRSPPNQAINLGTDQRIDYNAPNYNQTAYNVPNYNRPYYNPPNYGRPNYNPPNYSRPNYNPPNYNRFNYNPPNYNRPNYNSPNYNPRNYNQTYNPRNTYPPPGLRNQNSNNYNTGYRNNNNDYNPRYNPRYNQGFSNNQNPNNINNNPFGRPWRNNNYPQQSRSYPGNNYNPQNGQNNPRSTVVCYHCSKVGHVRANCFTFLRQQRGGGESQNSQFPGARYFNPGERKDTRGENPKNEFRPNF